MNVLSNIMYGILVLSIPIYVQHIRVIFKNAALQQSFFLEIQIYSDLF